LIARILIEITDEKEWQTAKVIAMQMAEKNDIQPSRIETCPFHRQQARWAAVHEKKPVGGLNEISALVTPAVTKSIATAKNMKFHDSIPSGIDDFLYAGYFVKAYPSNVRQARAFSPAVPFYPKSVGQHRSFER
jgi:hypothetical protein